MYGLVIDPLRPDTLYAGIYRAGVCKTTNGGTSWSAVNTGLTNTASLSLTIDPLHPHVPEWNLREKHISSEAHHDLVVKFFARIVYLLFQIGGARE
jgi:hypothetical protein